MVVSTSGSQKSVVGAGARALGGARGQRYAVVYEAEDGDDDDEGVKSSIRRRPPLRLCGAIG